MLNADDAMCVDYAARTTRQGRSGSARRAPVTPGVWLNGEQHLVRRRAADADARRFRFAAVHNVENVMAAAAAARLAGAALRRYRARRCARFRAVEHRLEFVRKRAAASISTTIRRPPTWTPR